LPGQFPPPRLCRLQPSACFCHSARPRCSLSVLLLHPRWPLMLVVRAC
jgi:hypothetical protein